VQRRRVALINFHRLTVETSRSDSHDSTYETGYTYNLYIFYSRLVSHDRLDASPCGPTDGNAITSRGVIGSTQTAAWPSGPDARARLWARQSHLELGYAVGGSVLAGACTAGAGRVGLPELADPAEQVVSELMTNAVAASQGLVGSRFGGRWSAGVPPVRLWLAADGERALVQVWDGNNRMPRQREPDPAAESGRGLWLVEALSEDWGRSSRSTPAGRSYGPW
jgi:hypothetical protein